MKLKAITGPLNIRNKKNRLLKEPLALENNRQRTTIQRVSLGATETMHKITPAKNNYKLIKEISTTPGASTIPALQDFIPAGSQ